MRVLISDLKVRGGRGGKWRTPQHAADLLASMEKDGLREPVTVTEDGWLISGWHRVEAAKKLGWEWIEARVVGHEIDEEKKRRWLKSDVRHSSPWPSRRRTSRPPCALDVPGGGC